MEAYATNEASEGGFWTAVKGRWKCHFYPKIHIFAIFPYEKDHFKWKINSLKYTPIFNKHVGVFQGGVFLWWKNFKLDLHPWHALLQWLWFTPGCLVFFGKWPSQMFLASLLQTSIQTVVDRFFWTLTCVSYLIILSVFSKPSPIFPNKTRIKHQKTKQISNPCTTSKVKVSPTGICFCSPCAEKKYVRLSERPWCYWRSTRRISFAFLT